MNSVAGSDVVILRWPDDAADLAALRARGVPRLFLVNAEDDPPQDADPATDWIRMPASDRDLFARIRILEQRAADGAPPPSLPGDGRLLWRGRWIAISPTVERVLAPLVEDYGRVVPASALCAAAWQDAGGRENALRQHLSRLRPLLEDLGLEVRALRDHGYVLQPLHAPAPVPAGTRA